jgi:hypothetical protein
MDKIQINLGEEIKLKIKWFKADGSETPSPPVLKEGTVGFQIKGGAGVLTRSSIIYTGPNSAPVYDPAVVKGIALGSAIVSAWGSFGEMPSPLVEFDQLEIEVIEPGAVRGEIAVA